MRVPLTTVDFLRRAEQVYGDRIGLIDEPVQPAPNLAGQTYGSLGERCRAVAAGSTSSVSGSVSASPSSVRTPPASSRCSSE